MTEHADQFEIEDVDPDELGSPGTVRDPELERQRAAQAAERERESRAASKTKYEELRDEQERESSELAQRVADVPEPREQ